MKYSFLVARILIQAALTQMILLVYNLYSTVSIPSAVTTTATLLIFLTIFQVFLSFLFMKFGKLKMIVIPAGTSLLTALALIIYPEFGFAIDFWVLFGILFIAGLMAHVLLWDVRSGPQTTGVR